MDTSKLRRHHSEILAVVGQIAPLCVPEKLDRATGDRLRKLLVDLSARIGSHLTSEDKVLYPKLSASKKPDVASTASRFAQEMGTIGGVFRDYMGKYPTGEAISKDPAKFSSDTKALFSALGNRIGREEKELYPLADAE